MLIFLYFCTGFAFATAVVSLANVVAYAWHGVRTRMESGDSGNVRGRVLKEMAVGWVVLGLSTGVLILLRSLYPG
ncbi:MAG: hypothetical protein ABIJ09_13195 [Pseudomonadota bacterium]